MHRLPLVLALAATIAAGFAATISAAPITITEWSAYNDQGAGAATHANATDWGLTGDTSGPLQDIGTGAVLPATLTITNNGAAGTGTMNAPNAGTLAATIFSPYVTWTGSGDQSALIQSQDTVTYAFTGLNPDRRYTFRGTGVRGNAAYTNRWTRAEVQGALSHSAAHSGGVLTNAQQPAFLNASQAAWNSGDNRTGEVVGWDDILPGPDGAFSIVLTQYTGDYSGGSAEDAQYGYAFQALRVQQVFVGEAEPPIAVADAATLHRGQKVRLNVLGNDTGFYDAATVVIVTPPGAGTAAVDAEGRVLYAHTAGTPSGDSFTYRVGGPAGFSQPATVSLVIANTLRITNTQLNVPDAPPETQWQLAPAFATNPGFSQPLLAVSPPGETRRLFVCEKSGRLQVIPDVTVAAPVPLTVLNLNTITSANGEEFRDDGEQGLLSVAFHPDFATNRHFFVFYSVNAERPGSDPVTRANFQRVSRFTMSAADPNRANETSEVVLIEQEDEASNHQGGSLNFGPDGYLYISLGDEGGGDDTYANSQKINADFFAAMMRIDVDKKPGSLDPNNHPAVLRDENGAAAYAVPPDNPYVNLPDSPDGQSIVIPNLPDLPVAQRPNLRTEFWAVGLRNPWRTTFDPVTGELWCADVGQNAYEEIAILTSGSNHGWAHREGLHAGPRAPVAGFVGTNPIYEYSHTNLAGDANFKGNSVTGGVVYRGSRFPALQGTYVFGDYVSGNIWSLRRHPTGPPTVIRLAGEPGIAGFGVDPSNGDVLLCDLDSGVLRRLVTQSAPGTTYPATLAETGLFADLNDLSPSPGLLPYAVNLPFWSDEAEKRRWMIVPDGASTLTYAPEEEWSFPNGTIWVKHFDLRTNDPPVTTKRLETRLLVKTAAGAYGVSYRWNEAGTQAMLVPDEGADFDVPIAGPGAPRTQRWHIPSRGECLVCHTPQAGHSLSFNTRQLNLEGAINGFAGNQLDLLSAHGFFSNPPAQPGTVLPRHVRPGEPAFSTEAKVRSYLAVNCAYCHQPGGTAGTAQWDGRAPLLLAQTGLVNGPVVANSSGDPLNRLVVPGDLARSVVLNRVAAANGFSRMPPLATNVPDHHAIALLTEWIGTSLPAQQTYSQWRQTEFGSTTSPEGEPAADPDDDGATNESEHRAGTAPLSGASYFSVSPVLDPAGDTISLTFTVPDNRSWQVESTTSLSAWAPWNVPRNNGLPAAGGVITISGPAAPERQYFRVRLFPN